MNWFKDFLKDEEGPTAVEYAVMMALILLVCIGSIAMVGQNTVQMMDPGGVLTGTLASGS
jgi:pilus assembly protein Flp/PilA